MSTASAARTAPPRLLSHLARAQALDTAPFTYDLPSHRIASRPLSRRDSSKLLVVSRDTEPPLPDNRVFADLPALLPRHSLIVRNATRVIRARLPLAKPTGGRAEALLLRPLARGADTHAAGGPDAAIALDAPAHGQQWAALLSGRNLRVGDTLTATATASSSSSAAAAQLQVVVERKGATAQVRLQCGGATTGATDSPSLRDALDAVAAPPLPPYIKRAADAADVASFQTTFARADGSVAAPTAALHVTDDVMQAVRLRHVRVADVVLHIGTATFRPVAAGTAGGHDMHCEAVAVDEAALAAIAAQAAGKHPVVAMGTTSVRTIESLYWFGVQLLLDRPSAGTRLDVSQWEPYRRLDEVGGAGGLPSPAESLGAVLNFCRADCNGVLLGETRLLVLPGYPFMLTDALITNFHQPNSTLLMLVSAFLGGSPERLKTVYGHALACDYRFLSYGDSSIYADSSFFAAARRESGAE